MTEAGLKSCVESMRSNSERVAKRYMEERPILMAVDAIDWRDVGPESVLKSAAFAHETEGVCTRECGIFITRPPPPTRQFEQSAMLQVVSPSLLKCESYAEIFT